MIGCEFEVQLLLIENVSGQPIKMRNECNIANGSAIFGSRPIRMSPEGGTGDIQT